MDANSSADLGLVTSKPSVEGRGGCYLAALQAPGLGFHGGVRTSRMLRYDPWLDHIAFPATVKLTTAIGSTKTSSYQTLSCCGTATSVFAAYCLRS